MQYAKKYINKFPVYCVNFKPRNTCIYANRMMINVEICAISSSTFYTD